MIVFITIFFN